MPRRAVVVLALVALIAGPAHADGEAEALAKAQADLAAGRFADAEAGFRGLLATAPGLLDAHRGLAESLAGEGRPAQAAAVLQPVAEALLDARPEVALELAERARALRPEDPLLALLAGRACVRLQRHTAAAADLAKAVELGDHRPGTALLLAAARWEAGDPQAAEAIYREVAATVDPSSVAAHQLGRLLTWDGRAAEALPFLEKAARARPLAGDVALDLARARAAAGDDAVDDFRRVVAQSPESRAGWYGLARALLVRGERDASAQAMERYRRLYDAERERNRRTALARAELDRGWQLLAEQRAAEAHDHFAKLEASPESLAGEAAAARALGHVDEAADLLERALALDPERDDLRRLLAELRASGT